MLDRGAVKDLRAAMREAAHPARAKDGIPAMHFVFDLEEAEELPFYVFMAVLSAQAHHPHALTFVLLRREPCGRLWELLKPRVKIVRLPDVRWFGVAHVSDAKHRADVIRLMAIVEIGGLSLSLDSFTLASMDALAQYDFTIGVKRALPGSTASFCNAIMVGRSGSRFASIWLDAYRSFDSRGADLRFDFHSCRLPMYFYAQAPDDVRVLAHDRWFFPMWNHVRGMLFAPGDLAAKRALIDVQFALHLWRDAIADTLDAWGPDQLAKGDCLYAKLCIEALMLIPAAERLEMFEQMGIVNAVDSDGRKSAKKSFSLPSS